MKTDMLDLVGFNLVLLFSLFATSVAYAQGSCIQSSSGQVFCAPPGGGIGINSVGQVLCGPGQCVTNNLGGIICSSQPGGAATISNMGQVVCVGGCVQANASYCQKPTR
jgi:hypothetical protein